LIVRDDAHLIREPTLLKKRKRKKRNTGSERGRIKTIEAKGLNPFSSGRGGREVVWRKGAREEENKT